MVYIVFVTLLFAFDILFLKPTHVGVCSCNSFMLNTLLCAGIVGY